MTWYDIIDSIRKIRVRRDLHDTEIFIRGQSRKEEVPDNVVLHLDAEARAALMDALERSMDEDDVNWWRDRGGE